MAIVKSDNNAFMSMVLFLVFNSIQYAGCNIMHSERINQLCLTIHIVIPDDQ